MRFRCIAKFPPAALNLLQRYAHLTGSGVITSPSGAA